MDNLQNKILLKDKIDTVLYHGSCSDGFGSAFIVRLYYKENYGVEMANKIQYIPMYYSQKESFEEFLKNMTNKNILMCDFSYPYDKLMMLINVAASFFIIDHHKTAKENLISLPDYLKIIDMDKSGVGITWEYFFPNRTLPIFLSYIQEQDLYLFRIEKTVEFITFFYEQEFDFDLWEKYLKKKYINMAILKGTEWLEYKNIIIKHAIDRAACIMQNINNKWYAIVYSNSPIFKSEIGNKLFNKFWFADFSVIWDYDLNHNKTILSFRSTNDRVDCSEIAHKYNGGGHRNASACIFYSLVGCLPEEKINDHNILSILLDDSNYSKGNIKINNMIPLGTQSVTPLGTQSVTPCEHTMTYTYILFKKEINNEWSEKHLDFLKNKTKDCNLIVFQKISDKITIINDEIIKIKDYVIIYNEQSITKSDILLQYMVYINKNIQLTFSSEKEFTDIINI